MAWEWPVVVGCGDNERICPWDLCLAVSGMRRCCICAKLAAENGYRRLDLSSGESYVIFLFFSLIDSGHSQLHMNKPFQTGIGQCSLFIALPPPPPTYRSLPYSRTRGSDLIDKRVDVFRYGWGSLRRLVFYSNGATHISHFIVQWMYAHGPCAWEVSELLHTPIHGPMTLIFSAS